LFSNCRIQLETHGQELILVEVIRQGKVLAVSDGSFQDQASLEAWTIESKNKQHHIWGHGQTPGAALDQNAYRSKLFGLWGILTTLQQITESHQVQQGSVLIVCNGLSAL